LTPAFDRALGDQLADRLGGLDVGAGLERPRRSFSSDEAAASVCPSRRR
jgi:hypothetical protein